MTIQSLTGKANNVALPSKPTQNGKVTNTDAHAIDGPKDSVDINITAVAKEITKAFESSKTTSPINKERVEAVRNALADGTYSIDAERVAEKMIEMEEQFKNSR